MKIIGFLTSRVASSKFGRFYWAMIVGVNVAVGVASFTLISWGFGQIFSRSDRPSNIETITPKLTFFEENKDRYDVIFIGSSRTYRHIMPSVFDRYLQKEGYSINSFNFGVPGMFFSETIFYLNKILKMEPKRLKWVIMELDFDFNVNPDNLKSYREIYRHTFEETKFICNYIIRSNKVSLPRKVIWLYRNLVPFIYNFSNTGHGADWLFTLLNYREPMQEQELEEAIGKKLDGHVGYKIEQEIPNRRKHFLQNTDRYLDKVQKLKQRTPESTQGHITDDEKKFLSQLVNKIQKRGISPIFIIQPKLSSQYESHLSAAYQQRIIPSLFSFNDPHKFEDLYNIDYRFDFGHLNRKGSQRLTHLLADRFIQTIEQAEVEE